MTCSVLEELGFIINREKSVMTPSKSCKYLGFIYHSETMTVELPREKSIILFNTIKKFRKRSSCRIRELAEFIGKLEACCFASKYGRAHMKDFERVKYRALLNNKDNYDSHIDLPSFLKEDLDWWLTNIENMKSSIKETTSFLEIFSDASLSGWGAYCNGEKTNGYWNEEERKCHINELELLAAFLG